jgi:Helix-turn-helix domain
LNQRAYYAIIPAFVRYDDDLPAAAKLLYGEITALCNEKGYCWARNKYFANLYKCDIRSIRRWITILIDKNYIKMEMEKGNIRKLYIADQNIGRRTKLSSPPDKNVLPGGTKMSSPSINNTINNKLIIGEEKFLLNLFSLEEKVIDELFINTWGRDPAGKEIPNIINLIKKYNWESVEFAFNEAWQSGPKAMNYRYIKKAAGSRFEFVNRKRIKAADRKCVEENIKESVQTKKDLASLQKKGVEKGWLTNIFKINYEGNNKIQKADDKKEKEKEFQKALRKERENLN